MIKLSCGMVSRVKISVLLDNVMGGAELKRVLIVDHNLVDSLVVGWAILPKLERLVPRVL